jgi:hypothetical protein
MLVLLAAPPLARNAFLLKPPLADFIYCKERSANQIDASVATFVCRNKVTYSGNADIDRCYIYDTGENVITKYGWIRKSRDGCRQAEVFFCDNSCQKLSAIICWLTATSGTAPVDVHLLAQATTKRLKSEQAAPEVFES